MDKNISWNLQWTKSQTYKKTVNVIAKSFVKTETFHRMPIDFKFLSTFYGHRSIHLWFYKLNQPLSNVCDLAPILARSTQRAGIKKLQQNKSIRNNSINFVMFLYCSLCSLIVWSFEREKGSERGKNEKLKNESILVHRLSFVISSRAVVLLATVNKYGICLRKRTDTKITQWNKTEWAKTKGNNQEKRNWGKCLPATVQSPWNARKNEISLDVRAQYFFWCFQSQNKLKVEKLLFLLIIFALLLYWISVWHTSWTWKTEPGWKQKKWVAHRTKGTASRKRTFRFSDRDCNFMFFFSFSLSFFSKILCIRKSLFNIVLMCFCFVIYHFPFSFLFFFLVLLRFLSLSHYYLAIHFGLFSRIEMKARLRGAQSVFFVICFYFILLFYKVH